MTGEYRIEAFFHGRPMSIWEFRNPVLQKIFIKQLVAFNFNKVAIARLSE